MQDKQTAAGDVTYDAALVERLAQQQYARRQLEKQKGDAV